MSNELDTIKSLIDGTKNSIIKWSPVEPIVIYQAFDYDNFEVEVESAFTYRYQKDTLILIHKYKYDSEQVFGTVSINKIQVTFTNNQYKSKFDITMEDLTPEDHYLWVLLKEIEKQRVGANDIMQNIIREFKSSKDRN